MKRKHIGWIMLIVLCAAGAAFLLYRPTSVNLQADGLKYRLGEGNAAEVQPVQVNIEGEVQRNWKGIPKFIGTIDIEGEVPEVPNERKKVAVELSEDAGEGFIIYDYFDNAGLHRITYGKLYTDKTMDRFSINVFEESAGAGQGWGSESGLVVTPPAQNRQEALKIANELMKESLAGTVVN